MNQGNFDRIIAAELAIALAMKLDPIMGRMGEKQDVRLNQCKTEIKKINFLQSLEECLVEKK
jgi:hypothetical protein